MIKRWVALIQLLASLVTRSVNEFTVIGLTLTHPFGCNDDLTDIAKIDKTDAASTVFAHGITAEASRPNSSRRSDM